MLPLFMLRVNYIENCQTLTTFKKLSWCNKNAGFSFSINFHSLLAVFCFQYFNAKSTLLRSEKFMNWSIIHVLVINSKSSDLKLEMVLKTSGLHQFELNISYVENYNFIAIVGAL